MKFKPTVLVQNLNNEKQKHEEKKKKKMGRGCCYSVFVTFFQCVHQEYLHRMPLVQDTEQEIEEEDLNDVLLK